VEPSVLTFVLVLQAKAKRVVLLNISMVRRNACCAPDVMLQEGWGTGEIDQNGSETT
jgi:hypothetical protein